MQNDILEFQGENRWLSNFWPCNVVLDDMEFKSVEAAYVAAKTTDLNIRKAIQDLPKAGDCKRFGRKIKLSPYWDGQKLQVMEYLLRQKFKAGGDLAKRLTSTGDCKIIEGNNWGDTFWGVCNGKGENNLGKILMKIRSELIADNERLERTR